MAEIIASIEPGQYTGAQTVTVTFPAGTRKAIITRGDRNPVLTEILAYDTGPIPPGTTTEERPFLAVTQDGRGNVVYDGGFPKFYNAHIRDLNGGTWPATLPTTLAGLPPACKYLLNALSFIANPRKVAQGNRKILFLNNALRNGQYNIMKSHYKPDASQNDPDGLHGFRDIFDAVCNIGNWTPTYFDSTSQGNSPVNVSLATMEQYAAIVYLASRGENAIGDSWITTGCAQAISQYRANGSGVAIITDHCGGNYTSIADAVANGSIFGGDASKVAQYFGAYFSGNVDRNPVSVGEIRRQIGLPGPPEDHPLLAGMSDSEYIFAGGSESLIFPELFDDDIVDPSQPWSTAMTTAGTYRVNVLVQMEDGTIITRPLRYVIINPSDIKIRDSFNDAIPANHTTYMQIVEYNIDGGANTEVLNGKIEVNGDLVSWFTATGNGLGGWQAQYFPLGGLLTPVLVKSGQTVKWTITDPFEFAVSHTITIPDPAPYFATSGSVSTFTKKVLTHPYFTGKSLDLTLSNITDFASKYYQTAADLGTSIPNLWWKQIGKARLPFASGGYTPIKVKVYTTPAQWTSNKPAFGVRGDSALIASTNDLYYWDDLPMEWKLHPKKAPVLFEVGRKVINTLDNSNWILNSSNTTKV